MKLLAEIAREFAAAGTPTRQFPFRTHVGGWATARIYAYAPGTPVVVPTTAQSNLGGGDRYWAQIPIDAVRPETVVNFRPFGSSESQPMLDARVDIGLLRTADAVLRMGDSGPQGDGQPWWDVSYMEIPD